MAVNKNQIIVDQLSNQVVIHLKELHLKVKKKKNTAMKMNMIRMKTIQTRLQIMGIKLTVSKNNQREHGIKAQEMIYHQVVSFHHGLRLVIVNLK